MTDERDSKLVLRAEAALAQAAWREPDWDALAERIENALVTAAPSDESVLLPPLPESAEDDREAIARAAASKPGVETGAQAQGGASLAELARAAVARRSSKDAVNLAKESLAIASQGRALPEPAPAPVPATPVVELEHRTAPSRPERAPMDTRGPWLGVAIATLGLAAGFGLYIASRRAPEPTAESKVVVAAAPSAPATPATATQTAAGPEPATAVAATETAEPSVPSEPKAVEAAPAPSAIGANALPREAVALKGGTTTSEPRATTPASGGRAHAAKVVLEDEAPADTTHADAKPAPSSPMRPAELNAASGMSDRPSTGAAQAAVGAVLGAARACVAGQPEASSATIVFGSSGEVTSVKVSGAAEGTPAAACVKSALAKARVQPFAASNFSLGVTIRPM
jgi:hypothetical protein